MKIKQENANCVDLVAKIADGHVVGSRDREEGRLRRQRSGRILGSIEGLEGQFLKLFKQCRNQPLEEEVRKRFMVMV